MSDSLVTLYAQEVARLTHRAIVAEARAAELEAKLAETTEEKKDGVHPNRLA